MHLKNWLKVLLISGTLLTFVQPVYAITAGSDNLSITSPEENEKLAGTVQVEWSMADADQQEIPVQIDVFSNSCLSNGGFVGQALSTRSFEVEADQNYSFSWNTSRPLTNGKRMAAGSNCLRICAVMVRNTNNYYSLCEKVTFNYDETSSSENKPPKITSNPSGLLVEKGGDFSYQVIATDPDGDTLEYTLESSAKIFEIDKEKGLVKNTEKMESVGVYELTVTVTDGKGGQDEQTFSITVQDGGEESPYKINVSAPESGKRYDEDKIKIAWKFEGEEKPARVVLEYGKSPNGTRWESIVALDGEEESYEWSVAEIESAVYYMRFTMSDELGRAYYHVTPAFGLKADPGGAAPLELTISEVIPADNADVKTAEPRIQIKYQATQGTQIDTSGIVILLDGSASNLECEITELSTDCATKSAITSGKHTLEITVKDTKGGEVKKTTSFNVVIEEGFTIGGRPVTSQMLAAGGGVLCLGILLLSIPWFISGLFARRRDTQPQMAEYPPASAPVYEPNSFDQALNSEFNLGTTSPPPTAPVSQSSDPLDLTYNSTTTPAAPASASTTEQIQMPSAYTSDEIPDWLKDFDSNTPVNPAGGDVAAEDKNMADGAKVHDDYGLSLNEDNNTSSSNQDELTF